MSLTEYTNDFDDDEDFVMENPLKYCITVGQLIEELKQFDQSLPVVATYRGRVREGEYFSIKPTLSNLALQNTDGDPEFYGEQECVLIS